MKTLTTFVVFGGSLLGTKGDKVRVLSNVGEVCIVQNIETGKRGIVKTALLR
jgi:hypothetical protein